MGVVIYRGYYSRFLLLMSGQTLKSIKNSQEHIAKNHLLKIHKRGGVVEVQPISSIVLTLSFITFGKLHRNQL